MGHWNHEHERPGSARGDSSTAESRAMAAFSFAPTTALSHAVRELDRLATHLHDWLSSDTWTAISALTEAFESAPLYPENDLSDVTEVLNRLIQAAAAVSGLIRDGMNRGPSWRFLDLGRCIERTTTTAQMLLCADLRRAPTPAPVLKTIIELLDSQMTYRFRYRDQLQRDAVLDLGITDDTNPRSLSFQILRLQSQVSELPTTSQQPLPGEEDRLVMRCSHAVRMLNHEDLAAASAVRVIEALKEIEEAVDKLATVLTRNYLVHSGVPRRIEDVFGAHS
jgi:uncharacterized alpha-E superfamily protein